MSSNTIVVDARIRRSSTGRYVDRLVEHLQKIDHQNRYIILVQPDDPWEPKAANFYRIECRYAQFSLNPFQQLGFAWQLYCLRAALVHFPLNSQPVLYFGKTVVTTMDLTMLHYERRGRTPLPFFKAKMALFRFLFWYSNRKAAHIIAITNYVKSELGEKYPFTEGKTTTTYEASEPPIASEASHPAALQKKWKMENGKLEFIFYVGMGFPHKNLQRLIEAFELLHISQPELHLVLAGKKEQYYTALETQFAESPARPVGKTPGSARSQIIFTDFVSDAELKWLYEHAEAYVFPSLSEGFGLPGLEAMVHGCPVVSSNATCLPEVYGDAAHYFDPNNIEDMASKISEVLKDKKLRTKLVKNGHKQVKKYSWSHMAEQTLEVYGQALGK